MQSRICPKCREVIPIDHGFYFDDQLNMIHDQCKNIVFSTTSKGDLDILPVVPTVAYGYYGQRNMHASNMFMEP